MDNWKKEAEDFFNKIKKKIEKKIPQGARVKDMKWNDKGLVKIIYEH